MSPRETQWVRSFEFIYNELKSIQSMKVDWKFIFMDFLVDYEGTDCALTYFFLILMFRKQQELQNTWSMIMVSECYALKVMNTRKSDKNCFKTQFSLILGSFLVPETPKDSYSYEGVRKIYLQFLANGFTWKKVESKLKSGKNWKKNE